MLIVWLVYATCLSAEFPRAARWCWEVQSTKYIHHLCCKLTSINLDVPALLDISFLHLLISVHFFFLPLSASNLFLFFFSSTFLFSLILSLASRALLPLGEKRFSRLLYRRYTLASHAWALHLIGLKVEEGENPLRSLPIRS